jgi:NAD(P)H-hydrate epimerase
MSRRDRGDDFTESMDQGVWVLSREAVRRVDRLAVERYGIPSVVLMENAALGLRERALELLASVRARRAVVVAGPGNNGGDGFALARHLHNAGCEVVALTSVDLDAYAGDAATNLRVIRAMGIRVARLEAPAGPAVLETAAQAPALLVDALLGTGAAEAARGTVRSAILHMNRLRSPGVRVLAVDVPSGLDCDSGAPAGGGDAVEADATVTFVALKPGFLRLGAQRWTGEVTVADIGAPGELIEELGELVEDTRRGPTRGATRHEAAAAEEPPGSHARGVADGRV